MEQAGDVIRIDWVIKTSFAPDNDPVCYYANGNLPGHFPCHTGCPGLYHIALIVASGVRIPLPGYPAEK